MYLLDLRINSFRKLFQRSFMIKQHNLPPKSFPFAGCKEKKKMEFSFNRKNLINYITLV